MKKDEDADGGVACRSRRNETKQTQVLFAELTHGKQQQGVEAKASAAHAWLLRQLLIMQPLSKGRMKSTLEREPLHSLSNSAALAAEAAADCGRRFEFLYCGCGGGFSDGSLGSSSGSCCALSCSRANSPDRRSGIITEVPAALAR